MCGFLRFCMKHRDLENSRDIGLEPPPDRMTDAVLCSYTYLKGLMLATTYTALQR